MTRTLRFGMMLVLAASAYGCDEKKDAAPATPVVAAPTTPAPAAPVAAAPAPAGDVKPGDAPKAGEAPKMGEMGKALGDAMNAAAQAKGANPCETAYLGMEAMMKGLEKSMGAGGAGAKKELPPKDKFVAACKELPEPVQQCLTMEHAMAHQKECQEAQSKLDPAKMAKLKELMGKKG